MGIQKSLIYDFLEANQMKTISPHVISTCYFAVNVGSVFSKGQPFFLILLFPFVMFVGAAVPKAFQKRD